MTSPVEWDRHSILGALRRSNKTLAGIAEDYGLPASCVKNIWTRPHEGMERAIADVLGKPVEVVFRDRYPKRRNKIHISNHPKPSRSKPVVTPQQDAA
ncbi:helix-turn-helix domain-containing protein [Ochrobactrum teleogrylli]|uniref:Transcriptional regulator n=1 Tax=Ochrobactrum teleogrylli TaxID=2479765 RepID=A0ABY2Y7S7_9HYPH|nr:helix-turn-helix domain-containing protein [[Ochrobactrum] teleogrylli]TNV17770.1 transcriptional regulator [[Ochrobactrum] teleogrylli]